ncbi:MAG: group II intron reverse transcriptase domain-containing protein [Oscillospiraceae bacterium]|nr:group II intron reverse transcriptase domain-containing protein [Oscillospiraceae bacterium]
MSILDEVTKREVWEDFLDRKISMQQLTRREEKRLREYIENERYPVKPEDLTFSLPEKRVISKFMSSKKRVVYTFTEDETWVLKLIAFLLYRYDDRLPDHCYSFRRNTGPKTAIRDISRIPGIENKYAVKLDIHNYFNSIDIPILMDMLRKVITDDERLLALFEEILTKDECIYEGEIIREKRGAMAGVPLASFFANVYLMDMDFLFEDQGVPYFRYSDDILLFADSEEEAYRSVGLVEEILTSKKLEINPDKTRITDPGEIWEFLGFSYVEGKIDLAQSTVRKMNRRIKVRANKLRRSRKVKGLSFEEAATAMIRYFDRKFYDLFGTGEYTWTGFYFPVITSTQGLARIDSHMQMYLRFLYTGKHTKANFRVRYDDLKKLGYTPLVSEYYRWEEENRLLRDQNKRHNS